MLQGGPAVSSTSAIVGHRLIKAAVQLPESSADTQMGQPWLTVWRQTLHPTTCWLAATLVLLLVHCSVGELNLMHEYSAPGLDHRKIWKSVQQPDTDCSVVFVVSLVGTDHQRLHQQKLYSELMIRSMLQIHHDGCVALLVNERGVFQSLHQVSRGRLEEHVHGVEELSISTFSYDRLKAYQSFLAAEATRDSPRHTVFCDADLLILGSFSSLWDEAFDVGLTFRDSWQRINTGVILFHAERLRAGTEVLGEILRIYDSVTAGRDPKRILGDQVAASMWAAKATPTWDPRSSSIQRVNVGSHNGMAQYRRLSFLPHCIHR